MRPSPHQHPSSSSIHSAHSPSSSNTSVHVPSLTPTQPSSSRLALPTPPRQTSTPTLRTTHTPFYPPLPWQSFDGDFPPRRPRRRRKPAPQAQHAPVQLPPRRGSFAGVDEVVQEPAGTNEAPVPGEESSVGPSSIETPPTSHPPSEMTSTQPTTPSSTAPPQQTAPKVSTSARPIAPLICIVPAIPNLPMLSQAPKKTIPSVVSDGTKSPAFVGAEDSAIVAEAAPKADPGTEAEVDVISKQTALPTIKAPPKSWAELLRTKDAPAPQVIAPSMKSSMVHTNGSLTISTTSLAGALSSYSVQDNGGERTAFIEPRGLVNTGNLCYMNSILQVLVYCVPLYSFLGKIGRQAAHSFKCDTPMMDSMIMFMREFPVIDAAVSVDQLRMRLKDNELEQYGEAFIPEFVYDVIRRLPRFSSMRRGHQQDAEEFLGFLLEELHDECSTAMRSFEVKANSDITTPPNGIISPTSESCTSQKVDDSGWLEVGPKQRAATTRSSGTITTESPITKIFGGKLRSELRIPGLKSSVTLEPYQPLQLDIGAPHVSNILDALKGLTKPETLYGDFNSPRGPGSTATKQVTIETLPQVLILHLKRFQYDNAGGTQKIWKKVGYPLDLEIPKEVFPQHKRGGLVAHGGLPKYHLIGVVYHHGKNAGGGHYTVDVRRQDGREWIRIDDTLIRRIRSEDVAEGGSEEDPKVLAAALEQHRIAQNLSNSGGNVYEQFDTADEEGSKPDKVWKQVSETSPAGPATGKRWSSIANGNVTPKASESGKMTPVGRPTSVKDNKVAYILFYQKLSV
ncbi:MAG: hypothetical protein Q9163_002378 [Psora crenata]